MTTNVGWTQPCFTRLKEMWASGHSAGQIARHINTEFGCAYSRNAVIGKVKREGLIRHPGRPPKAPRPGQQLKSTKRKNPPIESRMHPRTKAEHPGPSSNQNSRFFPPRPETAPAAPRPVPQCPPAPDCPSITIVDLTSATCRWPLERNDEGERLFCGAPVGKRDRHKRYCDHHRYRELQHPGRRVSADANKLDA